MPKTYTVKEIADILGFSTNSIYTFLKEKRIKGVRIGKGRFRIPEEELSRVLHLSKKPERDVASLHAADLLSPSSMPATGDAALFTQRFVSGSSRREDDAMLIPNLFDWFVGLAAIVAGVALFIFNASTSSPNLSKFSELFPFIRVVLIAAGLGVIVSGGFIRNRIWHGVFLFSLSVMGFANVFGLARSGDIEGALIYTGMALVTGIAVVVPLGGIVSVLIYATLLAIFIPVTMLFFPYEEHLQAASAFFGMPVTTMGLFASLAAAVVIAGFWYGYAKHRAAFIMATVFAAACDMALAIWYANMQYWSRSFFMVIVGFFTGLLPYWWLLQQHALRRQKALLHGIFIAIGGIMLIAILVVSLLQQNVWKAKETEFLNKIKIAQNELQNATMSVQSSVTVAAMNAEFVETIVKRDLPRLTANAKIIYESNPDIRRLVFLDKDGMGIALYPYGTFDEPNFAYRDYYKNPKATGKPYVSDVFKSLVDHAGRYVAVVSVPLYDKKGDFAGVIAASLALDRLGMHLAQIAADKQGEYFVVTDAKGIILTHPDNRLVGTQVPATDPLVRGINGEMGVQQSSFIDGSYGMIAYANVPALRWGISLRAVSSNVFELTTITITAIFGVITVIMLSAIAVIGVVCGRTRSKTESGP